jgi:hypothetical protein
MATHRTKLAAGVGTLALSGLLPAIPAGTSTAFWQPVPCIALRTGNSIAATGFCPAVGGAIDWDKTARLIQPAAGGSTTTLNPAHVTASPS